MRRFLPLTVVMVLLSAAGAAQAQVVVPETLELRRLDAPDAAASISECIGQSTTAVAERFIKEGTGWFSTPGSRQLSASTGGGVVISSRGQWACIRTSPMGFPIWPLETMADTVVPVNADPVAVKDWQRHLLERIAERGTARGLLVFPNGNAMQLDFTAQAGSALYVVYTRTFVKAGDVDESSAQAVLRDPSMSGVKVSDDQDPKRPGHPGHLAIPFDRLTGKPQVKAP